MKRHMKKLQVILLTLLLMFVCSGSAMAAQRGLVEEWDGIYYYYKGEPVTNKWKTVDGKTYYFNKNGKAVKGPQKIDDKYYFFKKTCVLMQPAKDRFFTQNGKRYFIYKSGEIRTGWFKKGSYLYYGDEKAKGALVATATHENVYFNKDGQAQNTKARGTVTSKIKYKSYEIVGSITKASQTKAAKLKSCWNYIVGGSRFHYYAPYDPKKNIGKKAWQQTLAYQFLTTKKGTCSGFACGFAALADACGYSPKIVVGTVPSANGSMTAHTWVEIDGRTYDPEGYRERYNLTYATKGYPMRHTIGKKYDYKAYV